VINTDFVSIVIIALGLSADCFAVAISSSITTKSFSRTDVIKTSLSFGIFQSVMTILGWLAGRTIVEFIASFDHWMAFILLAGIGGKMIWESFHSNDNDNRKTDIKKELVLLMLSLATSIDALAVGLSFAFLNINIVYTSGTIGTITLIVTAIGFFIGRRAGKLIGKRAEFAGGLVLIAIGLRILIAHLLNWL
jgi:putative Mn2+ efflux pump MntP